MQLSAVLGHPDQPHFPHPPPPPHHTPSPSLAPGKKKSPSQLRRQERRKCEAKAKADKAAESFPEDNEKGPSIIVSTVKENQLVDDAISKDSAEILSQYSVKEPLPNFKCNEYDYIHNTDKGLGMHKRISQVDGTNDSDEEISEESTNVVSVIYNVSVKDKKTVKEVINDLTDHEVWEHIEFSGFNIEEDMNNFSVELVYSRDDFPEDFTVTGASSLLESLPWPENYSVISSQPPKYQS